MIGCFAHVTGEAINVDPVELAGARWFDREQKSAERSRHAGERELRACRVEIAIAHRIISCMEPAGMIEFAPQIRGATLQRKRSRRSMLTKDHNEMLVRTGPGTPMGELFRRFWLPVLLSEELPAPDCTPARLRILGEDLVAFRDSSNRVGLIDAYCPHRGASLFFGRNEENGSLMRLPRLEVRR